MSESTRGSACQPGGETRVNEPEALARLLSVNWDTPLELGDIASILASISRAKVVADLRGAAARQLDDGERRLLRPRPADTPCIRQGVLLAGGAPAAAVTAVILPRRVPRSARAALGITEAGTPRDRVTIHLPLGRLLRNLDVRREQVTVVLGAGPPGPGGRQVAVRSTALLKRLTDPVALVTEDVYADFLGGCPLPWPRLPALLAMPAPGTGGVTRAGDGPAAP